MLLKQMSEKDFETLGKLFHTRLGEEGLDILIRSFYNTISFTPGDPYISAFKEGQRDIVQVLCNAVKHITDRENE